MTWTHSPMQGRITMAQCIVLLLVGFVLVALFFPMGFIGLKESPSVKKAETDIRVIANAVQNFYQDYGRYPVADGSSTAGDFACGDPAAGIALNNAAVFNVLRDLDAPPNAGHVLNP